MGRKKKNHKPINDTFDGVIDNILKVKVESKRTKKDKKESKKDKSK